MIYGFGGRIDNDSNAVTMIDKENRTAETIGYVNGEYVEFGGSSDFSTAEVTIIDPHDKFRGLNGAFVLDEDGDAWSTYIGNKDGINSIRKGERRM